MTHPHHPAHRREHRNRRSVPRITGTLTAAITTAGLLTGIAAASPQIGGLVLPDLPWPAPATGGPMDLPDREATRTTADGWVIHAKKTGESVNIAPPLDGTTSTGEAFGTLTANVWIDGAGTPELTGAWFTTGYQIGCGIDMSDGIDVELASAIGISPHATAGIEGGPSVQVELPNITGVNAGADATAKGEVGIDGKLEAAPTVSAHLNPGGITNVDLASIPVDGTYKRAAGGFSGAHLQITGCAGPVSIRSYVTISTTSPTSIDAVSAYGEPQRIR